MTRETGSGSKKSWIRPFALLPIAMMALTPACPPCDPPPVDPPDSGTMADSGVNPQPDGSVDLCTQGLIVFGPETFERQGWAPVDEHRTFTVPNDGEICIFVENNGVCHATIEIDGQEVFAEGAINSSVTEITATTTVTAGDHDLHVKLCSTPDKSLAITIRASGDPPPLTCLEAATSYCESLGWTVVNSPDPSWGNIVCTIDGRSAESNCETCATYYIIVWKDGSAEQFCPGTYSTLAGNVYSGHDPCECGDNLRYCGTWDMQDCVADP